MPDTGAAFIANFPCLPMSGQGRIPLSGLGRNLHAYQPVMLAIALDFFYHQILAGRGQPMTVEQLLLDRHKKSDTRA